MAKILTDRDADETMEEPVRVYCWRHEELTRAGYPLALATALAAREEVDLHLAVKLLERGCSPTEAARILL